MSQAPQPKEAVCGVPSLVWRDGQERRLDMIRRAAGGCLQGRVLEDGCGVGMYVQHLQPLAREVVGLEYDFEHCRAAKERAQEITNAAGENLPFPDASFDLILSHEVLEHVRDDRQAVEEMRRVLRPGGRLLVFVPNRGYPVETHGIYRKGEYHFGNIPLVNYLPRKLRDRLAPHVRVYSTEDLKRLFDGLPFRVIERTIIFGAYDNIISRSPRIGRLLRSLLQGLEKTPFRWFGISHFWVLEKVPI